VSGQGGNTAGFGDHQLVKGVCPYGYSDWKMNLNTYLHLISRSRMLRLYPFHMQLRGILLYEEQVKLDL